MRKRGKRGYLLAGLLSLSLLFTGCGGAGKAPAAETVSSAAQEAEASAPETADPAGSAAGTEPAERQEGGTNAPLSDAPALPGLTAESVLPLHYAACYNVFTYSGGYRLIDIPKSGQYLVIPEGKEAPEGLDPSVVCIPSAPKSICLAATSAMALFDAIGAVDAVTMSGTSEGGWYIDAPLKALEEGKMVYAGKYSEPDYETMLSLNCDLAVESTMILHTPAVQEMIGDLGIPVLIDRSAYEREALGRTEWVKLYGALMGKDAEADAFFREQEELISGLDDLENTGKTVAYFSVNTDGSVVVRTDMDYIPGVIEKAGGVYVFGGDFPEEPSSTKAISMEEFYSKAHDADFLVYNATIEEALGSAGDLAAKDAVFAEFRAVKEGNVWQADKKAYQSTDRMANLILDFHIMLTGGKTEDLTFLEKLDSEKGRE